MTLNFSHQIDKKILMSDSIKVSEDVSENGNLETAVGQFLCRTNSKRCRSLNWYSCLEGQHLQLFSKVENGHTLPHNFTTSGGQ